MIVIHWGFLILAFVGGFAFCYALLYQLAKLAAQVEDAIAVAAKAYY